MKTGYINAILVVEKLFGVKVNMEKCPYTQGTCATPKAECLGCTVFIGRRVKL